MGYQASSYKTTVVNGITISKEASVDVPNIQGSRPTLPAAVAGVLSTRTDANTGIVTVTAHSLLTSDTAVVSWLAGGVRTYRYNVDITAVTSTTVSIDLGAGSDLPTATTAVTISKQYSYNADMGDLDMTAWEALSINGNGEYLCILEIDSAFYPEVITPTTPLTFVNGDTAPDGAPLSISNVLPDPDTSGILKKFHFGNIATSEVRAYAEVLHA